ncbi:hypothetical protein HKX48_000340 [Thoreauomyces humboldtii]|nr:hypothetical protein HKX48_000340 [Thoreauomyces humboldtii]
MALYHTHSFTGVPVQHQRQLEPQHHQQQAYATRPRAISWPTRMPQPELSRSTQGNFPSHYSAKASSPEINTVHVAYRPGVTDRGHLYLHFRTYPGFELFAFYDHYCFVRFVSQDLARQALLRPSPDGIITLDPAQKNYRVPYPQPEEDSAPCKAIHVTHLPTNYTKEEMCKVFRAFPKFIKVQFHGKYGYVFFEDGQAASTCWRTLRTETNLVVSYAKNAKLEEEDTLTYHLEKLATKTAHLKHTISSITSPVDGPMHVIQEAGALSNPMQAFYHIRSKLHNIPTSHFANGADEFYTFLPRDSVRQLDADITDDFEQLLLESTCRLCPQSFMRESTVDFPHSHLSSADGDSQWHVGESVDTFARENAASDIVSPGGCAHSESSGGRTPDGLQNYSTAPWAFMRKSSFSSVRSESRDPRSPTESNVSNGSYKPYYSRLDARPLAGPADSCSLEPHHSEVQQRQKQEPGAPSKPLVPKRYSPNPLVAEFLPLNPLAPHIARRGSFPLHTAAAAASFSYADEEDHYYQQNPYLSLEHQRQHQLQGRIPASWHLSAPHPAFPSEPLMIDSYRTAAPRQEKKQTA